MSSIVIKGNTSGQIELAAPDVAGSTTLTLPTGTGTVITDTAPKAGNVLQVVSANINNQSTTTSTSYVSTGITASITPSNTSSKILVITNLSTTNTTINQWAYYTMYRNGVTNLGTGLGSSDSLTAYYSNSGFDWGAATITYLDSPATTSSVTYTLYFKCTGGTAYAGTTQTGSFVTLMEIAG